MNSAVIGCGAISRLHIQGITAAGGKIVALCDTDYSKAEDAKNKYAVDCSLYTDYRQALDRGDIDVVHICTPHYLHAEMAEYALARNINVLCEKPICVSRDELARLEKAEKASSAQMGFCLQNRYNESVKAVKELLAARQVLAASGMVMWHRFGDYYTSSGWRGQLAKEGGSALINQSIHTLDLLIYLLGMPDSVTAFVSNIMHGQEIDTEDTFYAVFQGKNSFQLFGTTTSSADFPATISVITDKFRCVFDDKKLYIDGNVHFKNTSRCPGKEVWGNGHGKLIEDFYDCLRTGRKFRLDLNECSKSLKCVFAAYESNGATINIGE